MNRKEYLLTVIMEECSEIQQNVCKLLRFGEIAQDKENKHYNNLDKLFTEIADLEAAVLLLDELEKLGVNKERMQAMRKTKRDMILKYMEHSRELGTLTD